MFSNEFGEEHFFKYLIIFTLKIYFIRIRTEKNFKSHLIEDNLDEIRRKQITDDILCILIYGEILCNNYFQSKINQKPLDGGYLIHIHIILFF